MTEGIQNRVPPFDDPPPPPGGSGEMPQESLLAVVWRRRWIVLALTLLALAGGAAYLWKATPIYTSSSRVYVEQGGPRILNEEDGMVRRSSSYLYTQSELMRSTPILSIALESPEIRRLSMLAGVDNPIALIRSVLSVEVGKKDDIIAVSCESPYPEEAARLVNAVVDAYVTYQSKQRRSTAAEVLKILQKEKEKQEAELKRLMEKMLAFKQDNGALFFDSGKGNIVVERLSRLSDALTQAQLRSVETKAAYEAAVSLVNSIVQAAATQPGSGRPLPGDATPSELAAERDRLELQLALARRRYGPEHVNVQSIELSLQMLEMRVAAQDQRAAQAYAAAAQRAWLLAQRTEEEIEASFQEQQKEAAALNVKTAEAAMLESEYRRTERMCEILDSRIKELNVTEDGGILSISILEVARPAANPSKPDRTRTMAMALVLGLMLGLGCALLRDWMDQRLRSAEEVQAVLDVPVLGVVPHMGGRLQLQERGQVVQKDSMSDTAEAYRTVRTAVYFGVPAGQARTLLVTSPAPGDGKSTSASNLAIAMAQAGQRVLVLDGDFRKPMQHRIFEVDDSLGLSGALSGQCTLEKAIQSTAVERLDVLPCGPIPPNPSEILNSQAFADLLGRLAQQYDHVIVDSPPVMPVTDARILGALCDVTIMVLRAEKSTRKLSQHARDGLLSVGARILGSVVNDVPRSRGSYGYYSGYGSYRYGGYRQSASEHAEESGGNGRGKGGAVVESGR